MIFNSQLTFIKLSLRVPKDLIFISEDVVVNIKLICHRTLDTNSKEKDFQISSPTGYTGEVNISHVKYSDHTSKQNIKFVLSIMEKN